MKNISVEIVINPSVNRLGRSEYLRNTNGPDTWENIEKNASDINVKLTALSSESAEVDLMAVRRTLAPYGYILAKEWANLGIGQDEYPAIIIQDATTHKTRGLLVFDSFTIKRSQE